MLRAVDLDRGERKELWQLLERLDALARLEFLEWCCRQVRGPIGVRVTTPPVNLHETYADLVHLQLVYGLNLDQARAELEQRVRRL